MNKKLQLAGKTVIVGVSGGIAAYKTCEIVRLLKGEGASVHVVMTEAATRLITPLTFQALSNNLVRTDIFSLTEESQMGHIELADRADLILVAPATADIMARVAHGLAGDLLSTIICATKAPVIFAPAMNVNMFDNPITQANILKLKNAGYPMVGPASGSLACGWEGIGRMEEPQTIVDFVAGKLISKIKAIK